MQNLKDQLLKAGLISVKEAERGRVEHKEKPPKQTMLRREEEKKKNPPQQKKKKNTDRPHRMVDLSDPKLLRIFQLIEKYRYRGEIRGDVPFHFALRNGRVRKISLQQGVVDKLGAGQLLIVESGSDQEHVIIEAMAKDEIKAIDAEAIRFGDL